jgi:L,D-transpeptidase catalytic domain
MTFRGARLGVSALCALVALAAASPAGAAPPSYLTTGQWIFSGPTISLKRGHHAEVLERVVLAGRVPIPAPRQRVTVTVEREGKPVLVRSVATDPRTGRYHLRMRVKGCCSYIARAAEGSEVSNPYAFEVRAPRTLEPGRQARLFNRLLDRSGFRVGDEIPDSYTENTGLAILAMRKTNDLGLSESYEPGLFAMLLRGRGRFQPEHDDDGRHVEVDVSRQVMALVEDGRATDVFHVSTGSGGTPRGEWTFYDQAPGYNAKGMYYSSYYDGNYATHGYASVPTYPASHGCTRNPMPHAVYIYDWIDLGDTIYVYD